MEKKSYINIECMRFYVMPKKKLHVWREDPHGDKEDNRPVEIRKKPDFSMKWTKLKELL